MTKNLIERYEQGDCLAVWSDMIAAGPAQESGHPAEHEAVARMTIGRIRRNLERIVERLRADDYAFVDTNAGTEDPIEPLIEPDGDSIDLASWLDETFQGIPLSLKTFLLSIGEINLLGRHPCWDSDVFKTPSGYAYPDPLVVELGFKQRGTLARAKRYHLRAREEWLEWKVREGKSFDYPFGLDFAADPVHKAGYSGGSPYRILVPDRRADGLADLEGPQLFFLDYLRDAILNYGGFYGLREVRTEPTDRLIEYLIDGLEPF